jgi:hypothetical protein
MKFLQELNPIKFIYFSSISKEALVKKQLICVWSPEDSIAITILSTSPFLDKIVSMFNAIDRWSKTVDDIGRKHSKTDTSLQAGSFLWFSSEKVEEYSFAFSICPGLIWQQNELRGCRT